LNCAGETIASSDNGAVRMRGPQHYGFFQLMTLFTVSMLGLVLTDSMVLL
jgi:multicomponent Na+:H+ antiporter subunit A